MMQGQVAGQSRAAQNHLHAFITGADGEDMTDLNFLVDLPQGMILARAMDIRDNSLLICPRRFYRLNTHLPKSSASPSPP